MPRLIVAAFFCFVLSHAVAAEYKLPAKTEPTVLLITDQSLAKAWQPFASFKTSIGLPTKS